jgi:hypothetical protein
MPPEPGLEGCFGASSRSIPENPEERGEAAFSPADRGAVHSPAGPRFMALTLA